MSWNEARSYIAGIARALQNAIIVGNSSKLDKGVDLLFQAHHVCHRTCRNDNKICLCTAS